MYYAVIQRPEIDLTAIKAFSEKYDPHFGLVGPHVTLVFPVQADKVSEADLKEHIHNVAIHIQPFSVHFSDLELAWDQWLFLTPLAGRQQFDDLHDELYTGVLAPMLRSDIPYIPHIALGHFAAETSNYDLRDPKLVPLDGKKYQQAREEIEKISPDYYYDVDSVELISVNDEFTNSVLVAKFQLGN